jgi:chaperonin GroEL
MARSKREVRRVVFQPDSYLGIQRGINQMADAIRPTLGPLPRVVAVEHPLRHRVPELLDSGGTIAQRIIQLPDRDDDMGAMFLRHVVRHVHEKAGDGTATAAVLLQAIYNQGVRYITAGGNPMRLRHYLQQGTWTILAELNRMTVRLKGQKRLARLAEAICHDPPLAKLLGEIFDIIGEYGRLEVRVGNSRTLEREYVEGMYWEGSIISREMITDFKKLKTELWDAAILISNLDFEEMDQLVPVLKLVKENNISTLMIIANKLSEEAIALLLANTKPDQFQVIAAKAPGIGPTQQGLALQDLAILTGGQPFLKLLGGQQDLSGIKLEDLGQARRAWADLRHFGIIGGKGNPRALRQYISDLRASLKRVDTKETREDIQKRLGKLISGSATLKVGGATNAEIRARMDNAERTAEAIRGAIIDGVLPGAGVALLACRPALQQKLDQATDPDERAAYGMLIEGMAEPFRTIVSNAGHDPGQIMGRILQAGSGYYGFDVMTGCVVDVVEAGILDSAAAQKMAVQSAIASAALALTTEVLVHHKNPKPPAQVGPGSL